MVDNVELNAGSGGQTVATDDIGGAHYQIVKLTFGALDAQTIASSESGTVDAGTQRVVLATDVALPAGTNAIGKLAANSGVDIGDVDITSIVPLTGATNLGKSIDNAVGSTDTGIAMLGQHKEDSVHLTTADGDYDVLELDSRGALSSNIEQHHIFDSMNATTGWAALGNDTLNLATTTIHALGTNALTFDKVDGAANTVFAGIEKTLSSTDLGALSPHDLLQTVCYVSDTTNINYTFLRVGTDSSNYNEWRIPGTSLTSDTMETLAFVVGDTDHGGSTGTGWDASAITYIAIGMAFNAENDTLSGIIFDEISYHTNTHTSASIQSEVTSSVSSSNVNVQKVGNQTTNTNTGNAANGTQRVVLASDQPTVSVDLGANNDIQGDVAHDTADSGNPVKIGAHATSSVEGETQVANSDRVDIKADLNGVLLVRPHTTQEEHISERISNTNGTSTDFTNFAAGGAGIHNYVTDVTITNTSATDAYVDLRDGAAGAIIWTFPAPANSGATHSFSLPLKGAANTALAYDVSAAITTMFVAVNGFQGQG